MVEAIRDGQSVWLFAIDFDARTEERTSDEASGEASETAELSTSIVAKTPATTRPAGAPRVRRFNAAGRELF